ncbi:MAG: hypothetical protein GY705_08710, partial [Bacteroidetes bacterium]|nr:hypothetical protein [Bacteroidota bacterium]
MKKSRLIRILRTFSKKEIRDLRKWVLSPIHNQRDDVRNLLEFLIENDHLFVDDCLEKEVVFFKIFHNETYDDGRMRQVMHFLIKTVEDFLTYQELHEDGVRAKIALARVYRKRKLDKSFHRSVKITKTLKETQKCRDEHFLYNEYLLQKEEYTYLEGQKRIIPMNLQEMSDTLDISYLASKLRQSCLMLAHQRVYKTEYAIGLIHEVLEYVEKNNFLKIPAIAVYYYVYLALTNPIEEHHFKNLKETIFEYGHLFSHSEARDIYLMAINYCIGRMNAGENSYVLESF